MASIWFVSAPLFSHTDWGGFSQTAVALQALGHDVVWVSEESLRAPIETMGLHFQAIAKTGWLWPPPPPPDLSAVPPQEAVMLRYTRALDTWLSVDLVAQGIESLLALGEAIGKPDLMVIDPFLSAAALAAEKLGARLIVCGWPAQATLDENSLFPVQRHLSSDSQQRIARLCQQFGLQGLNFSQGTTPAIRSPHLHICYFTRGWYIAEAATLLPQNQFVGGMPRPPRDAPPQWLVDIPPEQPLALITLGTTFSGDLGFFSWAAHAVAREDVLPIVVLGWQVIEAEQKGQLLKALPKGTRLLNWAPFEHILPRAKLMIHHGGMGTTHAAVVHAVPQIVVPHAADQRIQARRVAQAKVGLHLSAHDVRQGKLWEGTQAILNAEHVYQNARALAAEMAALGGPARAAQLIADLL